MKSFAYLRYFFLVATLGLPLALEPDSISTFRYTSCSFLTFLSGGLRSKTLLIGSRPDAGRLSSMTIALDGLDSRQPPWKETLQEILVIIIMDVRSSIWRFNDLSGLNIIGRSCGRRALQCKLMEGPDFNRIVIASLKRRRHGGAYASSATSAATSKLGSSRSTCNEAEFSLHLPWPTWRCRLGPQALQHGLLRLNLVLLQVRLFLQLLHKDHPLRPGLLHRSVSKGEQLLRRQVDRA